MHISELNHPIDCSVATSNSVWVEVGVLEDGAAPCVHRGQLKTNACALSKKQTSLYDTTAKLTGMEE